MSDDRPFTPRMSLLRRDDVVAQLRAIRSELEQRFGVRPIGLYGSIARDEARPDSDVDVLVEYLGPVGLGEFMGAIEYLEQVFGTRVDLTTLSGLKPRARPYVERDLIRVA